MGKTMRPVRNRRGLNRRGADDGVDGSWAGRQVPAGYEADLPLRHPGAGPPADAAAPARPRAGPEHRRLHLRLSRLAARQVRPGAVARESSSSSTTSTSSPASTRTWRRPRSGAASRSACSPAPRSMACSACGTARVPASTARGDVFKHANSAGTSQHGGVLALAGDDQAAKSSTLPHQTDQVFAAAMMPVLNPSSVQEISTSACTAGRCRAIPAAGSASRRCPTRSKARRRSSAIPIASRSSCPTISRCRPAGCRSAGPMRRWSQERGCRTTRSTRRGLRPRQPLNRIVLDRQPARLGIITTGKAYLDVRQALDDLGIDDARCRRRSASASTRSR